MLVPQRVHGVCCVIWLICEHPPVFRTRRFDALETDGVLAWSWGHALEPPPTSNGWIAPCALWSIWQGARRLPLCTCSSVQAWSGNRIPQHPVLAAHFLDAPWDCNAILLAILHFRTHIFQHGDGSNTFKTDLNKMKSCALGHGNFIKGQFESKKQFGVIHFQTQHDTPIRNTKNLVQCENTIDCHTSHVGIKQSRWSTLGFYG